MHPTKYMLIRKNGMYCMLCGKRCDYTDLEYHHKRWRSITLKERGMVDNSYDNGILLCTACHKYVHTFNYYSEQYHTLMESAEQHKRP